MLFDRVSRSVELVIQETRLALGRGGALDVVLLGAGAGRVLVEDVAGMGMNADALMLGCVVVSAIARTPSVGGGWQPGFLAAVGLIPATGDIIEAAFWTCPSGIWVTGARVTVCMPP